MVKGFIFFKDGRIPFVVEDYRMELFTDNDLLEEFCKENNFKSNYILQGLYFGNSVHGENATFLVNYSMGSTCYLHCYILYTSTTNHEYDTIGLQSPSLDSIFRYEYEYVDSIRAGINLGAAPKNVYSIPFSMNNRQYELTFRIGHDNRLGLTEDLDRKGELLLPLHTDNIQECYDLAIVLNRLAQFMTSHEEVPYKRITLYRGYLRVGWFYCPLVSADSSHRTAVIFHEFDVMKYIPRILNNIALDSGNKITQSIPLGHIGNFESQFSPQRFMEQIMAFEYLFDKLDHAKAQDKHFPLKKELESMFNEFPQLLERSRLSPSEASESIKELRRIISHGHAYYYDFEDDNNTKYLILLLDKLIKNMSLKWIGFSGEEIRDFLIF